MTRVVETALTKKCSIPLIEVISIYTPHPDKVENSKSQIQAVLYNGDFFTYYMRNEH